MIAIYGPLFTSEGGPFFYSTNRIGEHQ